MSDFRSFAVIPAAGQSLRMGAPKLLLPWRGIRLLEATLAPWKASGVEQMIVVVRPDDPDLALLCREQGVEVVVPSVPPPEMKTSVQLALTHIEKEFAPSPRDAWLLAPADMPCLSPDIIRRLLAEHSADTQAILIPTLQGKRGHPVLFPWVLAPQVHTLGENEGLNALRNRHSWREVPCDDCPTTGGNPFLDIDTPEEYLEGRGEKLQ